MAGHGTRCACPHHCSAKEVQASGLGGEDHRASAISTAIPFLSFPGKSQETIPYYSRKIAPTSKWDLDGCGIHSIAKRAGEELENPSSVGWPGPALAINTAPTD